MADLYPNWAALAAAEDLNVDYRLPIRYNRSITACFAIHGGAIEAGTSEMADVVAAWCRHNYYSVEGIKTSNNSDLHITSTHFDEPKALELIARMDYCFSFHGMADVTPGVAETYVGGLDTVRRDAIILALQGAGFTASIGTSELDGSSAANITNKTRLAAGVQLEMSNQQRQNFFPTGSLSRANRETGIRTQAFYDYAKAVIGVANGLGGGVEQTPQYRLNLATPDDSMADFETWINSSLDKLKDATAPNSGTSLPIIGDYKVGDRFYKTDTKSIYILACRDPSWGWYWRPVHDAISPWYIIPATAMNIAGWTLNPVPANPAAIAFDNRGKVYWRGVIGILAGTIPRNVSHTVFLPLPAGLKPRQRGVHMLGHETLAVNNTATSLQSYQGARIFISDDDTASVTVRCFGGTAEFNRVHLGGVQYAAGSGLFFTP